MSDEKTFEVVIRLTGTAGSSEDEKVALVEAFERFVEEYRAMRGQSHIDVVSITEV